MPPKGKPKAVKRKVRHALKIFYQIVLNNFIVACRLMMVMIMLGKSPKLQQQLKHQMMKIF